LQYSQEKFGFGVQLHIDQEIGGNLEATLKPNQKVIEKWGKQIGSTQKKPLFSNSPSTPQFSIDYPDAPVDNQSPTVHLWYPLVPHFHKIEPLLELQP